MSSSNPDIHHYSLINQLQILATRVSTCSLSHIIITANIFIYISKYLLSIVNIFYQGSQSLPGPAPVQLWRLQPERSDKRGRRDKQAHWGLQVRNTTLSKAQCWGFNGPNITFTSFHFHNLPLSLSQLTASNFIFKSSPKKTELKIQVSKYLHFHFRRISRFKLWLKKSIRF